MHFGTGLKIAGNAFSGWASGRPRLTQCNLHLSFRCNLACRYCNYPRLAGRELGTPEWLDIIDQLARLGCCRVDLTGGEPLLRPDLPDIIARVRKRGMACVVASNGLLVPERKRDLAGANTLILSLDSLGPANDRLRGRGAGRAAADAIEAARSVGLRVKINAVMTADMLTGLEELIAYSRRLRLPLSVNMVRSGNPALWNQAAEHRPGPEAMREALRRLAAESRRNSLFLFSARTYLQAARWPDFGVDYIDETNALAFDGWKRGPHCQAGRFYLSLMPDGRAVPCALRFQAGPYGDASAGGGLEAAWRVVREHACLDCCSPCKLEQNYLYSGHGTVLVNFFRKHLFRVT
jgi:MoaA/NifB/PqqE/SkfB family radical SAM enzyme